VTDAYRQKARYRADITPVIHADGVVTLKIALYNHTVAYLKNARKVDWLKEKLWREAEFARVDTTAAASSSRQ
jgi:hypothetical protein